MNGSSIADTDPRTALALRGKTLYGDDFSEEEIAAWFDDEREGYFDLYGHAGAGAESGAAYNYAGLAAEHGFRWLPARRFPSLLGIGSADGRELLPLLPNSETITVLEPSDGFMATEIGGKPVTYVKPLASGLMPFAADSFDLVVCFNVLHHIPNVSQVIREMFRVVKPDGYVLLREPTHSMGDWRHPRRGLTRRERGIAPAIFQQIIADAGFEVVRETRCAFSLTPRLAWFVNRPVWTYRWIVRLDRLICRWPLWPRHYHATRSWHKLRPVVVAYVLRKP